jgi:hypothetical protein
MTEKSKPLIDFLKTALHLNNIRRSNEILGRAGVGKIKPFRTVQSLNFPPFDTNDISHLFMLIGTLLNMFVFSKGCP